MEILSLWSSVIAQRKFTFHHLKRCFVIYKTLSCYLKLFVRREEKI